MNDLKKGNGAMQPVGGVISVEQAMTETKRWRDRQHQLDIEGHFGHVKAFFIPMVDIKNLFEYYNEFNPTGVRAYIGMKEDDEQGCRRLRLLLVPATETEDFWNAGTIPTGGEVGSSIYDFTTPCPDTCSSPNPLNRGTTRID